MKLNCLIVDDEPIAQDILHSYILKVEHLHFIAKCNNALEAIQILQTEKIDIVFLDINMPILSGLEMLNSLQHYPNIILTTAYSEYAVKSYELGVTDYLLKPISFERFFMAINKITNSENEHSKNKLEISNNTFMFFKANKKVYKYYYNEIAYFEGCGNYVKVHSLTKKTIIVLDKLSTLENKLDSKGFIRVHKSYLINISLVDEISGNMIKIKEQEITIGQSYKERFWLNIKQ